MIFPEPNFLLQAPMHSNILTKKRLLPMKSLDQTPKATSLWQSVTHAALAQDRIPTRDLRILPSWRSVARTASNSVAQLPIAAEIMGVRTATRFDKAVSGRNGVAEHMLVSSRWTNLCACQDSTFSHSKARYTTFSQLTKL